METLLQTQAIEISKKESKTKSAVNSDFWAAVEFNRFGISPAILTVVVCISALAAAFGITSGLLEISLVGFSTGIFISGIIAIAPMRMIFTMALITLLIDAVIIAMHLI